MLRLAPGPGQQGVEGGAPDLAADHPLQHVGEPGLRVDAVQDGGADQGRGNGPIVAPPSLPAKSAARRVVATGRISRSTLFVSISSRPSSR